MAQNKPEEEKYLRKVQTSVTLFLHCGDYYLFLKRALTKRIDPGRLNGIGGRLEYGENFIDATIRETKEESGYEIGPENIHLCSVVKLLGGYSEDWVSCYFVVDVPDKNIPIGNKTEDGELMWIHKDKVLDSNFELVDDLYYIFNDIVRGKEIIYLTAVLNDDEKIVSTSISKLPINAS